MGLLDKALSKKEGLLDEMGKAMRDRLLELSRKKASPYTALSLLKAYGSFQIGICLVLKKGAYESYTSVGLGVEKIIIPKTSLPGTEKEAYKIDSSKALSLKAIDPRLGLWVFPLDNQVPHRYLLLLAVEEDSLFNPPAIAEILSGAREGFIPEEDKAGNPQREALLQELRGYHRSNPSFQGIILEMPDPAGEGEKAGFMDQVSAMVSSFAVPLTISARRSLVLFPKSMDRELLTHRLVNSLKVQVLYSFEADNPEGALELIQPYIDD
jgi:hypothetical protein